MSRFEYPRFCTRCHLSQAASGDLDRVKRPACLTQLHPTAFACAVVLPLAALGSYSQLSPITWPSLRLVFSLLHLASPTAQAAGGLPCYFSR